MFRNTRKDVIRLMVGLTALVVLSFVSTGGDESLASRDRGQAPRLLTSIEIGTSSLSPAGPAGGLIIPASCPSFEHTRGECTPNRPPNAPGGSGGGGGGGGGPYATGGGISTPPSAGRAGTNAGTPAFGENPPGACTMPLRPTLTWTYSDPDGDPQSAYQIQLDNNSNFSSPEHDTGRLPSTVTSYIVPGGALVFNTTYYWRVRVWDRRDVDYSVSAVAVSAWADGQTFSTQPHQAPGIAYTWDPNAPGTNQKTKFTDESTTSGGARVQSRTWAFQDGSPSSSSEKKPETRFASSGDKTTSLIVQDTDQLSCGLQRAVTVSGPGSTPTWKEIKPE